MLLLREWLCNLFTMHHFFMHLSLWEGGREGGRGRKVRDMAFHMAFGATKAPR